jgi:hypothetical protein
VTNWDDFLYKVSLRDTYVDHGLVEEYLIMRNAQARIYMEEGTFMLGPEQDGGAELFHVYYDGVALHYRGVEEMYPNAGDRRPQPTATIPAAAPTLTERQFVGRNFADTLPARRSVIIEPRRRP